MRVNLIICDSEHTCDSNDMEHHYSWPAVNCQQGQSQKCGPVRGVDFLLNEKHKSAFPSVTPIQTAKGKLYWREIRYNKLAWKKVNALPVSAKSSLQTVHNNAEKIKESTKSGTVPPVTLNMATVIITHLIIIWPRWPPSSPQAVSSSI